MGGESLTVVASSLEAFWFKGKEIALAMSIDTSLSNIGTALNDFAQPRFFNISSGYLDLGMWIGFFTCAVSLIGGVGVFYVERQRENEDRQSSNEERGSDQIDLRVITQFPTPYWLLVAAYSIYSMGVCLFDNISSDFFQSRFGIDSETAGLIIGLPSIIVIFLAPLFGFLIDYIGAKTIFSKFYI